MSGDRMARAAWLAVALALVAAPELHRSRAADGASGAGSVVAAGPALILPRAAFAWKTDGFGQVIGDTIECVPLPDRIRSIGVGSALPAPLALKAGTSSLRISATTSGGITRDIAALQWSGPVITWQRLPVPAATFEQALKGLASWMMANYFTVTLEDGRVIEVGTESQQLSVELGTVDGAVAEVAVAEVPKGVKLLVKKAVPVPPPDSMGAGPFLFEVLRSTSGVRVATYPDTLVDIEVTEVPAKVRISAMTPTGARAAQAAAELAKTDELLKGAPPEQKRILDIQRAAQQAEADELRKVAAAERVRPTDEPIVACLVDPRSGREYIAISIALKEGAPAGRSIGGASGSERAPRRGSAQRDASRSTPPAGRGAP
jgi:hypothetical protein